MATSSSVDHVFADPEAPCGYARSPEGAATFHAAAAHLREVDGWRGESGEAQLKADLILEGGGVKGVGLVGAILVLSEAGYRFPRVAGPSAGAIVGAFVASIEKSDQPMHLLRRYLESLHVEQFTPMGAVQRWLEDIGTVTRAVADASILTRRSGLHSAEPLLDWLGPILRDDFGVETFADLRIGRTDDRGTSLAESQRYRLVVYASDITRGQLVRLPWDYNYYGLARDEQGVATAVRASMSIPLFFEPVVVRTSPATVEIPLPDGTRLVQRFSGGTLTWVDGSLLQNFPIRACDRADSARPRWPTIGIRLSRQTRTFAPTQACESAINVAIRCLHTATNEWDRYDVDQFSAARTIFVDNADLFATQFDVTSEQRGRLFLNGVRAATQFVLDAAKAGGIPRGSQSPRTSPIGPTLDSRVS